MEDHVFSIENGARRVEVAWPSCLHCCAWLVLLLLSGPWDSRAQVPPLDTTQVFWLGEVEVVGHRESAVRSLVSHLEAQDLRQFGQQDLSEALVQLPGVTFQRIGPRNEAAVLVRGFDLRRVPLYLDGIPVYLPYDGRVDLSRFTTENVSRVSVAKGFSSVLYGPNALGGAINVISRRPQHRLNAAMHGGVRSGGGVEADLDLGTRQPRWYALAGLSYLEHDAFPLSADFQPTPIEDGGRRDNATRQDLKVSAKVGFTPGPRAEYAIGYVNQQAEKGNPPYAGTQDGVQVRYWLWPKWDKQTLYALADQALGEASHLRLRLYHDRYDIAQYSYDDATYTTQARPYAFRSFSDDAAYGGSLGLHSARVPRHRLAAALHLKIDEHNDRDDAQATGHYRDLTWSLGVEDDVQLSGPVRAVIGLMYSARQRQEAESLVPVLVFPKNTNGSVDGQLAVLYTSPNYGELHFSVAHRTRFPTIRDRYSFRLGRVLPNPDLAPERAINLEAGYVVQPAPRLRLQTAIFYSRIQDVMQSVGSIDADTGERLAQLQNAGSARHVGAEMAVHIQPMRWLRGVGSYAYVRLDNLSNPELRFTHLPRHSLHALLELVPWSPFMIRGQVVANGARYSRIEGTELTQLDGFIRWDVEIVYRAGPTIRLEAGLINVFDTNYELVAGYPEAGRNAFARLHYLFQR